MAGGHVEADGRAAGGRAILRLREVAGRKRDLSRILDQHRLLVRNTQPDARCSTALPMPVWFRHDDGRIEWVNEAYVKAVEARDDKEVRERQIELLEMRQREAVQAALAKGEPYRERVHIISGGARKAHDVVVLPLDGATAGAAIDVAALETAQGELGRHVAAYERTLDRVATGVAIFGPDQRLDVLQRGLSQAVAARLRLAAPPSRPTASCSIGCASCRACPRSSTTATGRPRSWPATRPARSTRTGGICSTAAPSTSSSSQRPDGGLTYLYDDVTERFALESRYNALIDAQRETLDSLKEGVAVFATDGRLKLLQLGLRADLAPVAQHAAARARTSTRSSAQCSALYDDLPTWARISRAVTGISDRRQQIAGQMTRPDQSVIDFAVAPLPDGATLITFADVTDSKRYERALLERNEALVAADRLKNQFISHVSYELRTPLTNIIGFSELLTSPRTGDLNGKQREYLNDISASSRTLLAIINDILDLATIDAGALELKLAPVKVAGRGRYRRARRARPGQPRPPKSRHSRCRGCRRIHRRRSPGAAGALQSAFQRHRLLQARRHRQHQCLARGRHDGVRGRGQGRRHPQGAAAARVRALRKPQPGLQAPRCRASACRSSRAWSSCTAAACRWNRSRAAARA